VAASETCILGGGLVSALGRGLPAHAQALREGRAAPQPSPVTFAGRALPFHFASDPRNAGHSFLQLIEWAVGDALAEAALAPEAVGRMGLFVGSTSLDLPWLEANYAAMYRRGEIPAVQEPGYGTLARNIAATFEIRGPQYTLSTACSSSANALLYARTMLAEGRIDHALVVGAEGYNRLSLLGFGSLMLLTREGYRPFDRARDGLVLGEGVGAIILGSVPPGARGVRPQAQKNRGLTPFSIVGGATACDPSSPTNSMPERVAEVMREALDDAGVAADDVVAIKAHGTGTPSNDLSEGQAVRAVFGAKPPLFTSIKPSVGHTLGACGAIELLCMVACWRAGFLPPTPGFAEPDDMLGLSPLTRAASLPDGMMLCNFFGFGGNNTSLVLRAASTESKDPA
jgi:3-oxoacyl-[acyl-carrier-protein] synthase I